MKNIITKRMKFIKILVFGILIAISGSSGYSQNASEIPQRQLTFEKQMDIYITNYLEDDKNYARIKKNNIDMDDDLSSKEDYLLALLKDEATNKFIRANQKEYLDIYFGNTAALVPVDTLICDNGGFENDFLYYEGSSALFTRGSDNCTPTYLNQPVVYAPTTLPTLNRFEIVTSGVDPLIGINKTKFGNKAVRINNRYGHNSVHSCSGNNDVNRLTKRFKVDENNRDFTIWYAVALENPNGHINQQPFLNIKCDLAPGNELCFDADIVQCEELYTDVNCPFDSVDVLDWACHRFKIEKEFIGEIATLEIIVGDCAQGGHFGFAYVDGICEDCTGSSLGSTTLSDSSVVEGTGISYYSCDGNTATVCGTYTIPTICDDWQAIEITVPGYTITNVNIDTSTNTFCFDFPISNFEKGDCIEIYTDIVFASDAFNLPQQPSNSIEICKSKYETFTYTAYVSDCFDNGTDELISDDYYFVEINLGNLGTKDWKINRRLLNPYPDESGGQFLTEGTGDGYVTLGPFLIQEGDWYSIISVGECDQFILIEAPDYCSGCDKFEEIDIKNIECISATDEWTFEIYLPYSSGHFTINNGANQNYGTTISMPNYAMNGECQGFTLTHVPAVFSAGPPCVTRFIVCPPKPCDENVNCDLDVFVADVLCEKGVTNYSVELDISANLGTDKMLCYNYKYLGGTSTTSAAVPSGNIFGPFTADVFITISVCNTIDGCGSASCEDCYKVIYVPKFDCEDPRFGDIDKSIKIINDNIAITQHEFMIVPNPVETDEIILRSTMELTDFEIYDVNGRVIHIGKFTGEEHIVNLDIVSGIYFVRFKDDVGKHTIIKMMKL